MHIPVVSLSFFNHILKLVDFYHSQSDNNILHILIWLWVNIIRMCLVLYKFCGKAFVKSVASYVL